MNAHAVTYPALQRRLITHRRQRALFGNYIVDTPNGVMPERGKVRCGQAAMGIKVQIG
jgi:hypothetical protein